MVNASHVVSPCIYGHQILGNRLETNVAVHTIVDFTDNFDKSIYLKAYE